MPQLLPGKYNKKWLAFYIVMILILGAVLTICRLSFFKTNINSRSIFSLFIISIVLSSITAASGFFGARVICAFSLLGSVIGVVFMLYLYSGKSGWGDVAGLLIFIMIYIIATALGIIVELVLYYKNTQKTNERKK